MVRIIYYLASSSENPVKTFIDSLQKQQKAKVFRIFQYMEIYGLVSVLPHIKKVTGTPLWEIRILGKDNIRIFYVSMSSENILLLHGFIKKTQKTPMREINITLERLADWQARHPFDK